MMKIIILGAGQVGATLAKHLSSEHEITVVDERSEQLDALQQQLDLRTVQGRASYPNILLKAGANQADLLIAVTHSDETNMLACLVAHQLFNMPVKIARVRAMQYTAHERLFNQQVLPINMLINPEALIMQYIKRLIEHPHALQIINFAQGKVQLVCVRAFYDGPLVGHALKDIKQHMPQIETKIVAIFRRNQPMIPTYDTVIQPDDEIFFLATPAHIDAVMSELRQLEQPCQRVIIAGGGHIGAQLAAALEDQFQVKVIEKSPLRAQLLATELDKSLVLQGDTSDKELLMDENIQQTDVFCALTNHDEANIMSSILAKRLGAHKVMTLVNRDAYAEIIEGGAIDIVISPQQMTISRVLRFVRKGNIVNAYPLRHSAAEAIELIVQGSAQTSQVIGHKISEVHLPKGTIIGAIVRDQEVLIEDCEIALNDHVILFIIDKSCLPDIEQLFQGASTCN